jgi:hypothetical protein
MKPASVIHERTLVRSLVSLLVSGWLIVKLMPAVLHAADIEAILPRILAFSGTSIGSDGAEDFEIVAVGPPEDSPDLQTEMSGGEFAVSGAFVSIGTPRLAGFNELRLVPAPISGGTHLVVSWPTTVRVISVQATTNLAAPGSWTTLPVAPVVDGQTTSVTLPVSGPQRFYRLRESD